MSLTLTIVNQPTMEPGQIMAKTIEHNGTIGRATSNDWVLLDKSRYISGKHGNIEKVNDVYQITDTSTNGIYLNNNASPIGKGGVAVLKDGDRLLIGEFEISVSIKEDVAFSEAPATPPPSAPVGLESNGPVDPLAFFPSPNSPPAADIPGAAPPVQPPASQIPGGFDPLAGLAGNAPPTSSEADHASPLHEPFQPPNAIPDEANFAPPPEQASAPPSGGAADEGANILPDDLDFLPGGQTPAPQAPQAKQPPPAQPPVMPPVQQPPPQGVTGQAPPQARPNAASAADNAKALHAFLNGLGIADLNIPVNEVPAFMHNVGLMLRQTIQGSMSMLRARSNIKSGFRMSMTTIQAVENNPLKFSITVDEAINNMFTNCSNSYLQPVQALQEGFRDIENHQLAVMAGMQAALKALIERFDPKNLEPMFEQKGIGGLMPGSKKSKYWNAYETHFKEIAKYVEDDFQTIFGDEFSKAYETQIAKLNIMKK